MKKPLIKFLLFFVLVSSFGFAGVTSTREVLQLYSDGNAAVLRGYDRLTALWEEEEIELDTLLEGIEYAAEKHQGQFRKDADQTPYIIHPLGVAEILTREGDVHDKGVLTAALLHDTLEDTDATEEEVQARFGSRVLSIVKEVTNDPLLSSHENKQRQVDHAPYMSLDAKLVKLADRLYNVRDLHPPPPSWSEEKVGEYYQWGEKLLRALKGTNPSIEKALEKVIEENISQRNVS